MDTFRIVRHIEMACCHRFIDKIITCSVNG